MHFVSYREEISFSIILTISAVAPVLTGLQLMINAFICAISFISGITYLITLLTDFTGSQEISSDFCREEDLLSQVQKILQELSQDNGSEIPHRTPPQSSTA